MSIIFFRIKLIVVLLLIVSSGSARSAAVEITYTANISAVLAATDEYSIDPDEGWIDFVDNNIHVGDQITGTFRYHTNPDSLYQYYDSRQEPSSALYFYEDPSAGLDISLVSAGLTWSTASNASNPFRVTSAPYTSAPASGFDNIKGYGSGNASTFPEQLYRDYPYALHSLNLEIYINDALPTGEVPVVPIDMNNLNYGFGEITMSENWETEGLGDYFSVRYNITNVSTTISSVPLPGSLWLFVSGLLGALCMAKRPVTGFLKNA